MNITIQQRMGRRDYLGLLSDRWQVAWRQQAPRAPGWMRWLALPLCLAVVITKTKSKFPVEHTFEFSDDGVKVSHQEKSRQLGWSDITDIVESPRAWTLYSEAFDIALLVNRLDSAVKDELQTLLREKRGLIDSAT
ncbi:YcxB family protein [Pseudomarimonas arenosa]|uniref:Uncharacterized protein n=1 Tax=Pseudomarimonas arenosa TaxID=2774145 RepID=A0AAW3ZN86_9GAMM|nr:YcxB family protein [Pseudomarimonas arenosa]MBD8527613.1 hypothetical protein [Pseudomarimonas arenosa]